MDKILERFPFLNGTDWSNLPEDVRNYLRHLYLTYNGTFNATGAMTNGTITPPYWGVIHPIVMATVVSMATLFGLFGNTIVVVSLVKSHEIKTGSSILLMNLCIASLAFLTICAPILILHDFLYFQWIFGLFMCKFVPYVMHVTLYVITYTLALLSFYQYVAVSYPDRFSLLCSRLRTIVITSCLWTVLSLVNLPHLVGYDLEGKNTTVQCYHKDIVQDKDKARVWSVLYFVFFLAFPLLIMVVVTCFTLYRIARPRHPVDYDPISANDVSYKRKVTMIVLISLLLFSICWIPFQIILMLGTFHSIQHWTSAHTIALDVGMCLAYINPSVNPFIYIFIHPDVNRAVKEQISSCCRPKSGGLDYNRNSSKDASSEEPPENSIELMSSVL